MKKIIAIVLAVVMIAAMSVTVFAAPENDHTLQNDNNEPDTENVPVTYTSAQGYIVEIPEGFTLEDTDADGVANGSGTVKATKAKINIGKKLIVTVKSKDNFAAGTTWKLKEANGETYVENGVTIDYTIKVTDNNGAETEKLAQEGTVLSYTSSANQWVDQTSTMELTTAYTNQAGSFRDVLTFAASVVDANA